MIIIVNNGNELLGHTLRTLRIIAQLKQEDVAGRSGLSISTIGKIEQGETGNVLLANLLKFARSIDCEMEVRIVPR